MLTNRYEENCFPASFIADAVKILAESEIPSDDAAMARGRELQVLGAKLSAIGTGLVETAMNPNRPAISDGRSFGQRGVGGGR